jgi:hypothetical protein
VTSEGFDDMPEQISVAVIGAGMAGRSHAAAYRMAGSVSGPGLPPIRLAAIADANVRWPRTARGATATRRRCRAGRPSPRTRRSTR